MLFSEFKIMSVCKMEAETARERESEKGGERTREGRLI